MLKSLNPLSANVHTRHDAVAATVVLRYRQKMAFVFWKEQKIRYKL